MNLEDIERIRKPTLNWKGILYEEVQHEFTEHCLEYLKDIFRRKDKWYVWKFYKNESVNKKFNFKFNFL